MSLRKQIVNVPWMQGTLAPMLREAANTIECENTSKLNNSSVAGYYFTCSECGLSVGTSMNIRETDLVTPTCFRWGELYKFERCPRCGRVVKR